MLVSYVIAHTTGKLFNVKQETFGVFLIGSMMINIGFTLPFIMATYGQDGLARLFLFNLGNTILIFTFVYYLACIYGNNSNHSRNMSKKILQSPPLWAIIIAILLNILNISIPNAGIQLFELLGSMIIPLVMLSLGIYFSPKIVHY